jgi:hypothetical protein
MMLGDGDDESAEGERVTEGGEAEQQEDEPTTYIFISTLHVDLHISIHV